jgi:hypothetical protein
LRSDAFQLFPRHVRNLRTTSPCSFKRTWSRRFSRPVKIRPLRIRCERENFGAVNWFDVKSETSITWRVKPSSLSLIRWSIVLPLWLSNVQR